MKDGHRMIQILWSTVLSTFTVGIMLVNVVEFFVGRDPWIPIPMSLPILLASSGSMITGVAGLLSVMKGEK